MSELISRQALCEYALNQKDKCVTPNDIMRFPSEQPEWKKGEWRKVTKPSMFDAYRCALCSELVYGKTHFCPNCGADMRGEEDE